MEWYERFGIGFVSAILYPAIKVTQTEVNVNNFESFLGAILPFTIIGILIGLYASLVEKNEQDRGKLFRMCLTMPAFIIGLATAPVENVAKADSQEITCSPISDFQRGLYDAISAITGTKRPRFYLMSRSEATSEYLIHKSKLYYILGRFDKRPEGEFVYDIDKCNLL